MMPARSDSSTRAPNALDRFLIELFGRIEHRMIGHRAPGPCGGEHEHSRQLGRDLTQVLEMRSSLEDIGDRVVIDLAHHFSDARYIVGWSLQSTRSCLNELGLLMVEKNSSRYAFDSRRFP